MRKTEGMRAPAPRLVAPVVRALVVLVAAAGLVLVAPAASFACTCAAVTPEQATKDADTVAIGIVQWTADNGVEASYSITVSQVYKGIAGIQEKIVDVSPGSEPCGGKALVVDKEYIFFLEGKHPGRMRPSNCGGPLEYDFATLDAVESVAGGPKEPFPSFASGPESSGTDPVRVIGIGAIVLAAIGAVILLVRRWAQGHGGRQYLG
jgi:hypothetical protein